MPIQVATHTDIPDTSIVVEKGVSLSNLLDVLQIPHIQTMIIVYHSQLQVTDGTQ